MDTFEFIATLVGHLTWPVVVIWLGLTFREPLGKVVLKLTHLKAPGVEAEFGEQIAEVEAVTDRGLEQAGIPEAPRQLEWPAITDPSGAILGAWERLASTVADLAEAGGMRPNMRSIPGRALQPLHPFEPDLIESYDRLRNLRNQVAHGAATPTPGEAHAYVANADDLINYFAFIADHIRAHGKGEDS